MAGKELGSGVAVPASRSAGFGPLISTYVLNLYQVGAVWGLLLLVLNQASASMTGTRGDARSIPGEPALSYPHLHSPDHLSSSTKMT